MPSRSDVITPALLRDWALPVPTGGKEARGTVLVVGGSRFTPGAVLLAGVAALRAGAGVLQLAAAESTAASLSIQVPEALVVGLPETGDGAVRGDPGDLLRGLVAEADVVAVGPGLTDIETTGELLRLVLDAAGRETALVLDAYALGALSHAPELLAGSGRKAVLTPNLTEAKHLLGRDPGDDLDAEAVELAGRYDAVVSLYGHIATPDGRAWREESGDAGLGTSGSGDVRSGLLAGLLSRGADPAQAACWAAFAHAVSGQRLVPRYGRIGFLARELLDEIPYTIATV
ncbi:MULTISPECIES: NAD(P)H-hydrate dehydratase [Micromonospora]|uniref:NAD(P)H-hydrate dehydratase n=1 Tax=Micromonospora TaxID=1873 RepID=UPI0003EEAD76|nr:MULTISPECIES: NAD(P)H-hydrate dehydratase [Micromonospora]EWM63430.1 YjeF family protein [Micromonospora sp. M42]MCK1809101.1 NAD(P)H-hydrate dehydratase [Micromonospora sp. R42106]MCK1833586.1 NAD(P)H-hydrate dehydratase [Micromonospora sp. R42003]MCK1845629.1 NAD(P)H-hydrate dehydratase [Micromonospora sp. R42004]MCM1019265.1 NAD(P)H-hydrate dehydratase [Micromonospora sp. XM-20-01]